MIGTSAARRRVLEAAFVVFSSRTFEGAQMPAIAKQAGAGMATVCRHFPSKAALGNAAYRDARGDLVACLKRVHAVSHSSFEEEFARVWQCYTQFAVERPAAMDFISQRNDTFLDGESLALRDECYAIGEDFIRRGQRAGAVRAGAPRTLIMMAYGAFATWLRQPEGRSDAGSLLPGATNAREAVWGLLAEPYRPLGPVETQRPVEATWKAIVACARSRTRQV